MIWPALLFLAVISAYWNWRSAFAFSACITLTAWANSLGIPFEVVWFSAIYTGIGALCFFLWDRVASLFLAMVGLLFALQGFGYIPLGVRQFAGEAVFVAGIIAAGVSGPSGGNTNRIGSLFGNSRGGLSARPSVCDTNFDA